MADVIHLTSPAAFWAKVDRRSPDECWLWTGRVNTSGYGHHRVRLSGHPAYSFMAHRVAYHYEAGEIPEGMVVDHLCRNRLCCNPRHLEPVTNAENLRRGAVYRSEHPEARLSYLTAACRNDHPYVEGSYRTRKGGYRVCLECNRERQRRYEDRKRSA